MIRPQSESHAADLRLETSTPVAGCQQDPADVAWLSDVSARVRMRDKAGKEETAGAHLVKVLGYPPTLRQCAVTA
jgi:hypothetical protein